MSDFLFAVFVRICGSLLPSSGCHCFLEKSYCWWAGKIEWVFDSDRVSQKEGDFITKSRTWRTETRI